jgi:hypothetical protein
LIGHNFAHVFREAKGRAEEGLGRGGAEADDDAGFDDLDLGFEPGSARGDLAGGGLGMQAALAALLELEMLDGVC